MRAVAAFFAMLVCAPLWADECEQLPKPSVTVQRLDEPVKLNSEYSYRSLTTLGAALARPGQQVLGLTRGNVSVRFTMNSPAFVDRTGRWECSSPQITLIYGLSPITVYVGREFPEGSCAYKEIYEHEMRHVETYRTHTAAIEQPITEALNARFATGAAWRGPLGQTREKLQREMNERWIPFIQREFNRVEAQQALIDSPEEYARVAKACNGEIQTLSGQGLAKPAAR